MAPSVTEETASSITTESGRPHSDKDVYGLNLSIFNHLGNIAMKLDAISVAVIGDQPETLVGELVSPEEGVPFYDTLRNELIDTEEFVKSMDAVVTRILDSVSHKAS